MSRAETSRSTRMSAEEREALEKKITERLQASDVRGAADLVIRGYGLEVFGFLVGILRSRDEAEEAFARFSMALFDGLPKFQGRSLVRTWAYVIARNAGNEVLRGLARAAHNEPLADDDARKELLQTSRTVTTEWRKSSVRDAFRELRRELSEEQQTILILRIDRDLSWQDVACVTGKFYGEPSSDELRREVQRIKKQMERAIDKLSALGRERGLIPPEKG